jgi:hypothetical protein
VRPVAKRRRPEHGLALGELRIALCRPGPKRANRDVEALVGGEVPTPEPFSTHSMFDNNNAVSMNGDRTNASIEA